MEMNARVEAAGPDAPADQVAQIKAIHTKRHNAAVEELEANAARFNEQVKTLQGPRQEELTPRSCSKPAPDALFQERAGRCRLRDESRVVSAFTESASPMRSLVHSGF